MICDSVSVLINTEGCLGTHENFNETQLRRTDGKMATAATEKPKICFCTKYVVACRTKPHSLNYYSYGNVNLWGINLYVIWMSVILNSLNVLLGFDTKKEGSIYGTYIAPLLQ